MAQSRSAPSGLGALLTIVVGVWFFLQVSMGELVETIQSFLPGTKEPDHAGAKSSAFSISGRTKRAQFLRILKRQLGSEYEWGEGREGHRRDGFDCSGLIYFAMNKLGHPDFPQTSSTQIAHAKPLPVRKAARTAGAVVHFPGHIAVCVGDGKHTYEARGEAYGVVEGTIAGRGFSAGGIFPELV